MNPDRYRQLEGQFGSRRVVVIGDLMLDSYLWGDAHRISPEAPVPVVKIRSSSVNPGGAGNVAHNLASLSAEVSLIGVVGDDKDGGTFRSLMEDFNVETDAVVVDPSRPTTVKTRIIAHSQQVVRTDWEDVAPVSPEVRELIVERARERISSCDAVILEDYDKGVLSGSLIEDVIGLCRGASVPVYADPKVRNFFSYKCVTLLKPNLPEVSLAIGNDFSTQEKVEQAGPRLREKLECELLLVTRGEEGMSLFDREGHHFIPTKARSVHDVSGAGDTVIATFCLAHISGASPQEAAALANYAAGRVCEDVGVVPITKENLHEIILSHAP